MLRNIIDINRIMSQEKQSMKLTATTAGPVHSAWDATNTNIHLQIMKQNESKNIRLKRQQ